jgi:acyl-protein synthetase LuxE
MVGSAKEMLTPFPADPGEDTLARKRPRAARSLCHNPSMPLARIADFIANSNTGAFEGLALAAFAFQVDRIAPYRALCERRGIDPATLNDWREIPAVPVAAFKSMELAAAPAVEVFRSSGTTGAERSTHYHAFPDLYRQSVDHSFPRCCLPATAPVPMLSLIGDRALLPDSSLAFMTEHVLRRWGSPDSLTAFTRRGVETAKARSWLGARQRAGTPVLILATAFALVELLDALARIDLRFRLPARSAVFETGGYKGRTREIARPELQGLVAERLGVPPERIVREYGMTELTSQCYSLALAGGDPELLVPPHWVRVRVLDPLTLAEAPAGTAGVLAILDLANLGSAVHVLTEDLGRADGDGFRLLGRAAGADLRGCSLVAEELSAARA